jgi:hypothetical protein
LLHGLLRGGGKRNEGQDEEAEEKKALLHGDHPFTCLWWGGAAFAMTAFAMRDRSHSNQVGAAVSGKSTQRSGDLVPLAIPRMAIFLLQLHEASFLWGRERGRRGASAAGGVSALQRFAASKDARAAYGEVT